MSSSPTNLPPSEPFDDTLFLGFDVFSAMELYKELQTLAVTAHYHPQTHDMLSFFERELGMKAPVQ